MNIQTPFVGPTPIRIEEEERQMILLALAELSLARPGWEDALERIAKKMDNVVGDGPGHAELFHFFRGLPVKAAAERLANS